MHASKHKFFNTSTSHQKRSFRCQIKLHLQWWYIRLNIHQNESEIMCTKMSFSSLRLTLPYETSRASVQKQNIARHQHLRLFARRRQPQVSMMCPRRRCFLLCLAAKLSLVHLKKAIERKKETISTSKYITTTTRRGKNGQLLSHERETKGKSLLYPY